MLKLVNLTKSFNGRFAPVLNDINLELKPNDFCVIIGSNGSGKSTFLRSISGEYHIDKGQIFINNHDVTNKNRYNKIASVIQDVNKGTIPEMTMLENMALSNMRNHNASLIFYSSFKEQAINLVKTLNVGLEEYINQPLKSLSGGQRQMIATLMAINSKPQILLLDEHTSALDPRMQNILMEYTAQSVAKNNITTLMITHKLDDALKYGNRLIMLHKGKIVVDMNQKEKNKTNINDLISLFHKYEDLILKAEQ
jgi:putative tryptophan/tyrosine transport system ATP-binding protein